MKNQHFLFLSVLALGGSVFFNSAALYAACKEKDPRNAAKKRHGVMVYCFGGGGWEETTYDNGVQNGPKKKFYGNGKLQEETHYKNGKTNGPSKKYYDNGKLAEEKSYIDYNEEGVYKKFTEEGKLTEEAFYKAGKRNGTRKTYDERSGRLETVENYKDDERNGVFEEYGDNGKVRRLQNYVNGKNQGEQKKFFDTGEIEEVRNETAGIEDGWTLKYHNNSDGHYLYSASFNVMNNRKYYATFFAKGHQREATCYDSKGSSLAGTESCSAEVKALTSLTSKLGNKTQSQSLKSSSNNDEEFYSNGKPRRKCAVKDGKRHGKCETFFDSGTLSSKSTYQNGKIIGESIDFFENGKPKKQTTRNNSGELTKIVEFHQEGQKKKESTIEGDREIAATEYFMNESPSLEFKWTGNQKQLTKYYDNGKPSFKGRMAPTTKCYYSCWESMDYDGTVETFFEEGGLSQKTDYKDGKRQGKSISYWQNGKPRIQAEYIDGKMRSEKIYTEAGVIEADIEYFPDGSKKNKIKSK